jgi:hypothetical protein
MRRKPSSQGNGNYNNQQRKPRFQQGGSNGGDRSHGHGHGQNRPRKNYSAAREKYLAQARDALAAGDRVLAENYYQHADHCYRMMVEEGYLTRNSYTPPTQGEEASQQQEETASENISQLPAFLTASLEQPEQTKADEPIIVQNWEEN